MLNQLNAISCGLWRNAGGLEIGVFDPYQLPGLKGAEANGIIVLIQDFCSAGNDESHLVRHIVGIAGIEEAIYNIHGNNPVRRYAVHRHLYECNDPESL